MNLVGHAVVAARQSPDATASFVAGAMLPDLGAIARVRLLPRARASTPSTVAASDLAAGIALHHASDAAFHASPWFHEHNRGLRDVLLDAGVDRGAARACAHAGLEMLLDGELAGDPAVVDTTYAAFDVLATPGPARTAAGELVAPDGRAIWLERLDRISRSLDPHAYRSASNVADRLHRMTQGRARIELPADQVTHVSHALDAYRPVVVRDAAHVVDAVLAAIEGPMPANVPQDVGAAGP